jgi:ribosomal protein L30E
MFTPTKELKNSLSVGNRSVGTISNLNFDKLKEAKEVIISIRNELEFHQKQTIKYAILAGQSLTKIQDLCQIENKKFIDFLRECGINWSRSYIQFLISLYIL